jgi:hypothetical protein
MSNPTSVSVNSPTIPTPDLNLPSLTHNQDTALRRNSSSVPPTASTTDSTEAETTKGELQQRSSSAPPPNLPSMGYEAWRIGSTESLSKNNNTKTAAVEQGPLSPFKSEQQQQTTTASNLHEQSVALQQTKEVGECVVVLLI